MQELEKGAPNRPNLEPVNLDIQGTAALVLDLSTRCHDTNTVCYKLLKPVGEFLDRLRTNNVPIIYTISASAKGTPLGEVASPLKRRPTELIINPDGYDKFTGGHLQRILSQQRKKTLIMLGAATNIAVLYTSTAAARNYRYQVIIPTDGVIAGTQYEQEYALHQLSKLPGGVNKRIQFTALSMIDFDDKG